MSSSSKEGAQTKTWFQCHCRESFPSQQEIDDHALETHAQTLANFRVVITPTSRIFYTCKCIPLFPPLPGDRLAPIHIPDDTTDPQQPKSDHQPHQSPQSLQLEQPQHQQPQPQPQLEQEGLMEAEEEEKEESEKGELRAERSSSEALGPTSKSEGGLVPKKAGKRGGGLAEMSELQRTMRALSLFANKERASKFNFTALEMKECLRSESSQLCANVCAYIASWGIYGRSTLGEARYGEARSRLVMLDTFLQCESVWVREKGEPSPGHAGLVDYFFGNFLPALLANPKMRAWVKHNRTRVLTDGDWMLDELNRFFNWCRRAGSTLRVHFNYPQVRQIIRSALNCPRDALQQQGSQDEKHWSQEEKQGSQESEPSQESESQMVAE